MFNNKTSIAHYNTWDGSHDYLSASIREDQLPEYYITNFAFAHSLHFDLSGRDEYFRKVSETVKYWRNLMVKKASSRREGNEKVHVDVQFITLIFTYSMYNFSHLLKLLACINRQVLCMGREISALVGWRSRCGGIII